MKSYKIQFKTNSEDFRASDGLQGCIFHLNKIVFYSLMKSLTNCFLNSVIVKDLCCTSPYGEISCC